MLHSPGVLDSTLIQRRLLVVGRETGRPTRWEIECLGKSKAEYEYIYGSMLNRTKSHASLMEVMSGCKWY